MEEVVKYLKALVFLQISQRSSGPEVKPEILLQKAGLKLKEIAEIVGKNEKAVGMTISRAKAAATKNMEKETEGAQ